VSRASDAIAASAAGLAVAIARFQAAPQSFEAAKGYMAAFVVHHAHGRSSEALPLLGKMAAIRAALFAFRASKPEAEAAKLQAIDLAEAP
jgi:hypothetical protein